MKRNKLAAFILTLYILLFPIKVLILPYTYNKLQPADIISLLIMTAALAQLPKLKKIQLTLFDKAIFFWLFAHTITCLVHPTKASILEFIGTAYLVSLYTSINILFMSNNKEDIRQVFLRGFRLSALFLMTLGLSGIVMAAMGYPNKFVDAYPNFPYFGTVYRMEALTHQPIMMGSIASVFLLILLSTFNIKDINKTGIWKTIPLVLLVVGLPFTFAKAIVITFTTSVGIIISKYTKKYRKIYIFAFQIVLLFYLFAAHFVVIDKDIFEHHKEKMFFFLDQSNPVFTFGDKYAIKTGYALLKEKGLYVFSQHPLVGVGSGNLNITPFAIDKPNYAIINTFDPHSSFTGTLSEMGIIGFSAFLSIFVAAFIRILFLLKTEISSRDRHLLIGFLGTFVFMLCEGMATDVMNFRHYWLVFAFFAAWTRKIPEPIV